MLIFSLDLTDNRLTMIFDNDQLPDDVLNLELDMTKLTLLEEDESITLTKVRASKQRRGLGGIEIPLTNFDIHAIKTAGIGNKAKLAVAQGFSPRVKATEPDVPVSQMPGTFKRDLRGPALLSVSFVQSTGQLRLEFDDALAAHTVDPTALFLISNSVTSDENSNSTGPTHQLQLSNDTVVIVDEAAGVITIFLTAMDLMTLEQNRELFTSPSNSFISHTSALIQDIMLNPAVERGHAEPIAVQVEGASPTAQSSGSDGLSTGAIVGIVVGALVLIIVVAAIVVSSRSRSAPPPRQQGRKQAHSAADLEYGDVPTSTAPQPRAVELTDGETRSGGRDVSI